MKTYATPTMDLLWIYEQDVLTLSTQADGDGGEVLFPPAL